MLEPKTKVVSPTRDWSGFIGCHGHESPFLVFDDVLDYSKFDELHEEICLGLLNVDWGYTGGSHKKMGIVPPEFLNDEYADYGIVISNFSDEEFEQFMRLADRRVAIDMKNWRDISFGEDGEIGLSWKQILYLKVKYGVYFPWKAFVEFLPGDTNWNTKHLYNLEFPEYITLSFPKTCDYIRKLPFKSIGRCNLMGLEANDHGTIHRDNYEMRENPPVNDFITIAPKLNKDLFLYDAKSGEKVFVPGRIYTFNDMNYHGVAAAPHFRYSIRIDGIFTDEFRQQISA